MFDDADRAALRDLARIAGRERLRFFVIGAGARFLSHDWRYGIAGGRGTTDWDVALRVAAWSEYEGLRKALTAGEAPFRTTAVEHRFVHAQGRPLDIVPFGGVEDAKRTVVYPKSGTTHSVLGFLECQAYCVSVDLGDGVHVDVVAAAGLVVLKAQAYLDRRPLLTRDVQDIDFVARTYRDTVSDVTVFERASDVLQDERVAYEHVGAYLLGRDLAERGFGDAALAPLRVLLAELKEPTSRAVDDVRASQMSESTRDRETIARRYQALELGLNS